MSEEKPIHIPREQYPIAIYPDPAPPSPYLESEGEDIHILDYWQVIVSRRLVIIATVLTVLAGVFLYNVQQVPVYQATAVLEIDKENPNILSFKDVYEIEGTDDALQTQFRVLESRSLALRVIEDLRLERAAEFQPGKPSLLSEYAASLRNLLGPAQPPKELSDAEKRKGLIDGYIGRLLVEPVVRSRLVRVSFSATDPEFAARVINEHARHFIEQNLQFKFEGTQQASDFLSTQLVSLKSDLQKAEDQLAAYGRENQILLTDGGQDTSIEKLKQLEAEFTKAQAERFERESYFRLIQAGKADFLPQLMSNNLLVTLGVKLAELKREDSQLAVTYAAEYPSRKRLRNQIEELTRSIDSEKNKVINTIQAEYAASIENEALLGKALTDQRTLVNSLNEGIIQYNILKSDVDSSKRLYEGILTRLREARVSAGLRASNIRVVDQAEVPTGPIRPRKTRNLMYGLLAGLVLGIGFAFFQEYLDSSVKSPDDVLRYLGYPALGAIPKQASLSGQHGYHHYGYLEKKKPAAEPDKPTPVEQVCHIAPASLMSEAYRSMRTSLLLSSPDKAPRTVLITSALPSEGKTVTAVNTAISLTQIGARVLLVDADMRKPRIHTVFDVNNSKGLSSVLTGSVNIKDAIQKSEIPNLFLLICGPCPPNPTELIVSNRFRQMVELLRQYFDYIVVDSPPICNVSDARIVAALSDRVILVVKAFATSRHLAKRAIDHLVESRASIAGVVLNDVDVRSHSKYYSPYSERYYYASDYANREGRS